jgi:hypothetical protein
MFDFLKRPVEEDFGPGPQPPKPPKLSSYEQGLADERREREEKYQKRREWNEKHDAIKAEMLAAPPVERFKIIRDPDYSWHVHRWTISNDFGRESWSMPMFGPYLPDHEPKPYTNYVRMPYVQFKTQSEAENWLYDTCNPQERTFGYDKHGRPLSE